MTNGVPLQLTGNLYASRIITKLPQNNTEYFFR